MLFNRIIVWILIVLSASIIFFDTNAALLPIYLLLKTGLQIFILGWSAFLVISYFYESEGVSRKVIKIRRKSDHFSSLAFYGVVISIAQLALVNHYEDIFSFETVLVAIFFLYFLSQIVQNSYPKVMVSKTHLGHSDFQSTLIPWKEIRKIRLEPKLLIIQTVDSEKSIQLSGMEDISEQELAQELAAEVLDGSIASESTSKTLSQLFEQYAEDQGFDLESTI